MNILTAPSSDKCTYCKSLRMKASAKRPECKCKCECWRRQNRLHLHSFPLCKGSITLHFTLPLKERWIGKIATNLLRRRTPRRSCRWTPARCSAGTSGRRCASGLRLRENRGQSQHLVSQMDTHGGQRCAAAMFWFHFHSCWIKEDVG